MRAVAAAFAAFFSMALANPAPPALAEACGPPVEIAEPQATPSPQPQGASRQNVPAIEGQPAPHTLAGMLGVFAEPRMRPAEASIAVQDRQPPLPGMGAGRAYELFRPAPAPALPLTAEAVPPTLEARGFTRIGAVRQRGRSFLAEATGPRGERVRLVLDAASGDIAGMQVIGADARR